MIDTPEIEIGYEVQYQYRGDPTWFVMKGDRYEHRVAAGLHSETRDLQEAVGMAALLRDGTVYPVTRKPGGPDVIATRILQRVFTGTVILTDGQPAKED